MAKMADRIKSLRLSAEMTQEEFGKQFGIVKSTVSLYESGKSSPNDELKKQICDYFHVSLDYLLGMDRNSDFSNYQMDTSEFGLDFKCRLKDILKEKGISENDFSKVTGFHKEDADAYLWGNKIPSIEDLIKIAGSLHISADYLLRINEEAPISDMDRYFLKTLTDRERNIIDVYRQLNKDNQDIIVGEMKKCLKEQRYEDSVAAESAMREAK